MGLAGGFEGVHRLHSLRVRIDDLGGKGWVRLGGDPVGRGRASEERGPRQALEAGPSHTSRGRPWCRATRLCHSCTWCGFWRSRTLLRSRGRRLMSCSKRARRSSRSTSSVKSGQGGGRQFTVPRAPPAHCRSLPYAPTVHLGTPSPSCPRATVNPHVGRVQATLETPQSHRPPPQALLPCQALAQAPSPPHCVPCFPFPPGFNPSPTEKCPSPGNPPTHTPLLLASDPKTHSPPRSH